MLKVAVTGAAGRMGSGIITKITEQEDMEVVAAIEMPNTPLEGQDIGEKIGLGTLGVPITGSQNLKEALKESNADVLVDFTIAKAAVDTIKRTAECGVNLIIGTTGFSEEQTQENINNIKKNNVKAVISSNYSVGVNVFFKLLKDLTPILNDYDIEIIEAHHNQKEDSPSGTAMTAFETVAEALERNPQEVGVFGRKGHVGKRTKEEIGVHAIRGGDIVGDHSVMYITNGERLEINHRAHSRDVFIGGVIRALRFVESGEPGVINDMSDVLGFN